MSQYRRGDGIGVEYTSTTLRGVRLDHREPDTVTAIAEVPIAEPGEERSIVDALTRLRAELGGPSAPTRLAIFPPGTTVQRIDATGLDGPDLNQRRAELDEGDAINSTVLLDDGPRRWLVTVRWDATPIRAVEELVERAGFIDVAIDPSPLAICRVVLPTTTWLRRDAAEREAFIMVLRSGVPVAAITADTIGHVHPNLELGGASISTGLFDAHLDDAELAVLVQRVTRGDRKRQANELVLGERLYPMYPPHDVRAAERHCVALGAAVGAAGLAGRLRPVDMLLPAVHADDHDRPWAIERLTDLPPAQASQNVGRLRRAAARIVPGRRRS